MKRRAVPEVPRVDLPVGAEAWCIVTTPVGRSKEQRRLVGAARVRVAGIEGDVYTVELLRVSGSLLVGRTVEVGRGSLYATTGAEHRAFGAEVSRFWSEA